MRKSGGSWNNNPNNCRSAYRNNNSRENRNNNIGFRVVCVAPSTLLIGRHKAFLARVGRWESVERAERKSPDPLQ